MDELAAYHYMQTAIDESAVVSQMPAETASIELYQESYCEDRAWIKRLVLHDLSFIFSKDFGIFIRPSNSSFFAGYCMLKKRLSNCHKYWLFKFSLLFHFIHFFYVLVILFYGYGNFRIYIYCLSKDYYSFAN